MIKIVKDYVKPIRIVKECGGIINSAALLNNNESQVFLTAPECMRCVGKGYVILDFGKELCGGIRILSFRSKPMQKIRIRFGESVSETCAELGEKGACNDHSVRDFETVVPSLSDQEWGKTGFRFVRIDFLSEEEYNLINVYAVSYHRDLSFIGKFECDDDLVNKIYETAKYTVFLTMQEHLWEGVKRDRLIWIGDMHPQVNAILDLIGNDECIENAIELSVEHSPMPCWLGNIPTYSFWLIQILHDYLMKVGNKDFVLKYLEYIESVVKQLDACVAQDGKIDYDAIDVYHGNGYFLDWPSNNHKDAEAGNAYMFICSLAKLENIYAVLGKKTPHEVLALKEKIKKRKYGDLTKKQVLALGFLSGEISKEEAGEKIALGGAKGFTTFLSYFLFKTLSDCDKTDTALQILKQYYGAMVDRGATTFWEDFDYEWLKDSGRIDEPTSDGLKDLHGDCGAFCYKGFRHSLCHGWSAGPVHFLTEEVLGVKILDAGCKKIKIEPKLGNLDWCRGEFPTPYGVIKISNEKKDGKVVTVVDAPKEIEIVR